MHPPHNHNDRGTLHSECLACAVLAKLMGEAGLDLASPEKTIGGPARLDTARSDSAQDLTLTGWVNPWSTVRATPATFDTTEPTTLTSFHRAMRSLAHASGKTGMLALLAHCQSDHPHPILEELATKLHKLSDVQGLHSLLHATGIGHYDSLGAEHMVHPASTEKINSRARLAEQKHWSAVNKELKAAEHARRTVSAQEQRQQVQLESARALTRATHHALGTIVPRMEINPAGSAQLQVGQRKPLSIATISWGDQVGVGTALCRPGDRWDSQIGYQLAIARAFSVLGAGYEAQWLERERNR